MMLEEYLDLCPKCQGRGYLMVHETWERLDCEECDTTGVELEKDETFPVDE